VDQFEEPKTYVWVRIKITPAIFPKVEKILPTIPEVAPLQEQEKALLKATQLRPGQQLSTNLAQVVKEVRRAGLGEEELEDAMEALQLERRFAALLKLDKAKESRSIPALQKAIKEAQRAQADDELIMEAEEQLREEENRAMESRMKGRQAFKPAGQNLTPASNGRLRSPMSSVFGRDER